MEQYKEDLEVILANISKETLAGKLQVSVMTVYRWTLDDEEKGCNPQFATRKLLTQIANGYRVAQEKKENEN